MNLSLINRKGFLILSLFAFLKPAGFETNGFSEINIAINVLRIVFAGIIFLQLFHRRNKITKLVIFECLYFSFMLVSYLINGSEIFHFAVFAVSIIAMTLLIDFNLVSGNAKKLIDSFFLNYFVMILVNYGLIITEHGWGIGINDSLYVRYSFLSSDNATSGYIMPAIMIAVLYSAYHGRKLTFSATLLLLCVTLTVLRMWSATTIVGYVLLIIYILLIYRKQVEKYINFRIILFMGVAFIIGVTFFRIQAIFSNIIVDVLNKDISMTGRTNFWDIGLKGFLSSPILGNGIEKLYIDNMVVQVMYRGGVMALVPLIIMVAVSLKKTNQNNYIIVSIQKFVYFTVFIVLIMSITESWNSFMGFFIILAFANNSLLLEMQNTQIKNKKRKKYNRLIQKFIKIEYSSFGGRYKGAVSR